LPASPTRSRNTTENLKTTLDQDVRPPCTILLEVDLAFDPADEAQALSSPPDDRYETRTTLGEGGMGEVLLCHDRRMGRDVAMKVVHRSRADGADLRARFLREARVQGRLEHPAIVPVYDLAQDASGRTFFTMKRVRGETLEVVVARLAAGQQGAQAQYTQHKLLAAYARVCLAIDFAHARGVIHRDLKPANVMLGDFGEVYVLDWGVAKVGPGDEDDDDDAGSEPAPDESGERPIARAAGEAHTAAGVILGTPAYMAPEQLRGRAADARTDVYALGAILYEMLTLSSFHDRRTGTPRGLDDTDAEANVPPELDAIWRKATELSPSKRYASARELHDAVEGYLSGDRDLAARRSLVQTHLDAARALRAARPKTLATRSRALAEVGRAIALDPNDVDALRILVELLSEAPEAPPQDVLDQLEQADAQSRATGLKRAALLYSLPAILFLAPAAFVMNAKGPGYVALSLASFLAAALVAVVCYRFPHLSRRAPWLTIASSIAIACSSVLFGVYVFLPTLVVANTICHAITTRRQHRPTIVALGILTLLVPVALELAGIGPNAHTFVDGSLVLSSQVFELRETTTPIFLLLANIGMLVFSARYVGHYRNALARAELSQLSQLWQLRQLVPERARSATSEPPRAP
jgi:eukaryotic-like serine/threonine-protein kinase